jgi:oxygen-independent coproporphyrinogen-3 oxidase
MKITGDIGVYVHFPFCKKRCPYCDFKVDIFNKIPHKQYALSVIEDLSLRAEPHLSGRQLCSIYFGGGTPSLWSIEWLVRVKEEILSCYKSQASSVEITVEVNPKEVDSSLVKMLFQGGINRISMGVQSFNDDNLSWLGRQHNAADARNALEQVLSEPGFRVTFDLICALPGQTTSEWMTEISNAEPYFNAGHVSIYELTIYDKTPFGKLHKQGRLTPLDTDVTAEIMTQTHHLMESKGLNHYEISNYAAQGNESAHNQLYWHGGEYLGLGVGSHSMLISNNSVIRSANTSKTGLYLKNPFEHPLEIECLTPEEHLLERLILGLRTKRGIDLNQLSHQFEMPLKAPLLDTLERAVDLGLLTHLSSRYRPTLRGLLLADSLAALFM